MRIEISKVKVEYGDIIDYDGKTCLVVHEDRRAFIIDENGEYISGRLEFPTRLVNLENSTVVTGYGSLGPLQEFKVLIKGKNIVIQEEVEEEEE